MLSEINKFFISDIPHNRPLFYRNNRTVCFDEFKMDVARYSNVFSRMNTHDVILFVQDDIYLFFVCFMALMQAGKDVILPAMLNEQNARPLCDITNTIVTNQTIALHGFNFVDLSQDFGTNWDFRDMDARTLYFFTSGSTGTPKKITKTFHNLAAEVALHNKMQQNLFKLNPVMTASVVPYHMYGLLWRFLIPLVGGIIIDTDMIFTPEELQSAQNKFDKILFATTPSFLDSITKYKNQYQFADNCIGIFSSGSLLGAKTSKMAFDKFGVSPFEIFGSTETGGVAFRQQSGGDVWTIFDGVKTHTDDNGCIVADSDFCCVRPYPMSDVVEMQNEHQFLLKGRADRIVKIAEERISLPEYESKLNTHRFIEQSYVTSVQQNGRDIIGCVIVLNDDGKNFIISQGRRALVNDIKTCLAPWFPNVALPRKIRIVNEMPLNPQGKILKSEIINLLQSDMSEPVMQNLIKTDKDLSCNLTFLKDSAYFKGHFEECPILPGVIQLYFVVKFIQQFFHITLNKYDIMKLKFSNLVLPDTLVHFELHKLSDTEFSFSYENGDIKYSAGKIIIKE